MTSAMPKAGSRGRASRIDHPPLAVLRSPFDDTAPERSKTELGQNWKAAMEIGHDLAQNKSISRTSSQMLVLMHQRMSWSLPLRSKWDITTRWSVLLFSIKRLTMSPLIYSVKVVPDVHGACVLDAGSAFEFGRDRVEFQRYEGLMSPEIKRQGLPLGNQHVQKMQAAMATLDWISKVGQFKDLWGMLKS